MKRVPRGWNCAIALCLLLSAAGSASVSDGPTALGNSCEASGPQAPRDLTRGHGTNPVHFGAAPPSHQMKLCDIHFHRNAEHRAKAYSKLAGTGDHEGWACGDRPERSGLGSETRAEHSGCEGIEPGDTVEVHWVYTTCDVELGPGLGSCFMPGTCENPQLRVEAQVWYLAEQGGEDFSEYSKAAPAAPSAVQYLGSTTGPSFNNETACSPFQVTWRVRPECRELDISSLHAWCEHNPFNEDHAHGVRKLVDVPALLSEMETN